MFICTAKVWQLQEWGKKLTRFHSILFFSTIPGPLFTSQGVGMLDNNYAFMQGSLFYGALVPVANSQ